MLRTIALRAGTTALLLVTSAFAHHPSVAGSTGEAGPIVTIPATTLKKGYSSAAVVFEYVNVQCAERAGQTLPSFAYRASRLRSDGKPRGGLEDE